MNKANYKKYCRVIEQLTGLQTRINLNSLPLRKQSRTFLLDNVTPIVVAFNQLKGKVLDLRISETQRLLALNSSMTRLSTFELMEHDFRENTHSNILQYVFDYRLSGSSGSQILSNFIFNLEGLKDREEFCKIIQKKNYTVEREKPIDSGRIDLFICDNANKMVILVENKIYAEVSERFGEDDNKFIETQLDIYRNFVYRYFPKYKKLFILLSYMVQEQKFTPFVEVNYSYLYEILRQHKINDPIIEEYKILLQSIINNSNTSKLWLLQNIHQLKNPEYKSMLDLVTLEQFNRFVYENRR